MFLSLIMNKVFIPVDFSTTNVGKMIKTSKKRLSWKFLLDSDPHTVDLFLSRVSGKRVVLLDENLVSRNSKDAKFFGAYPVKIKIFTIVVYEYENNKFDLRLGNFSFNEEFTRKPSPHIEIPGSQDLNVRKRKKTTRTMKINLIENHEREEQLKGNLSPLSAGVHRYNPFDDLIEGDEYSHKIIESKFSTNSPQNRPEKNYCNSAERSPVVLNSPSTLNIFDEDFNHPATFNRIQSPHGISVRSSSPPVVKKDPKSATRLLSSKFLFSGQNFSRFTRKKSSFNETRRKISPKPSKALPKPISSKEIQRILMTKEERRMMDSLVQDEKKCRAELFQMLNLTISNYLKSPKRK